MWRITSLALVLAALALPPSATAAPTLVPVGTFSSPTYVTAPRADRTRLFVVERAGRIRIVRDGTTLATPFLDIAADVATDGERGMLSMAFAGDYEQSGLFYVYMVARDPAGELQVREYRRSNTSSDLASPTGRIVWRQAHDEADNHNGGQIAWGPDGLLWFATGDGGGQNDEFGHARDLSSHLGKMLRIDPRPGNAGTYSVPNVSPPNPLGTAVYAYGLRNPFRFSFDRATGDLLIGDVGQGLREEINWARAADGRGLGADYGWACREGTVPGPGDCEPSGAYLGPVWDYDQGSPRAVAGGYVVRDSGLPTLEGRYVYADTYTGVVRSLRLAQPRGVDDRPAGLPQRDLIVSFGEDACGRLYVVSLNGSVERVQDGEVGPCRLQPAGPPLPPQAPPAPPATPRPPDRSSPQISIRVARKGRVGRRATPRILLVANETCRVTISARLAGTRLKRVRTPLRGGRRTIVRLRPKPGAIKRIRRALRKRKRVTMVVAVAAVDAAGNRGFVQRRLKVRRG
jgi:Glucose / Sorbosone dehydrogenase